MIVCSLPEQWHLGTAVGKPGNPFLAHAAGKYLSMLRNAVLFFLLSYMLDKVTSLASSSSDWSSVFVSLAAGGRAVVDAAGGARWVWRVGDGLEHFLRDLAS